MRAKTIAIILVVVLGSLGDMAGAASTPRDNDPTPELLEFLGTWQTPDGTVISPFDLEDDLDDPRSGASNPTPRSSEQPARNTPRQDSDAQPSKPLRGVDPLPEGGHR